MIASSGHFGADRENHHGAEPSPYWSIYFEGIIKRGMDILSILAGSDLPACSCDDCRRWDAHARTVKDGMLMRGRSEMGCSCEDGRRWDAHARMVEDGTISPFSTPEDFTQRERRAG